MAICVFDSPLYRDLFHDAEAGKLFTDSAEVRAMLLVEGALAKAQGELGVIPLESALFIHRSSMEVQVDPAGLAAGTGQSAVCIPALVAAFRKAMEAPEHAQYAHFGATSQDIIDTGLILRLRQALTLFDQRLVELIHALGDLAEAHADTPMAARTWGQVATPTTFGAAVAAWGTPLIRHRERLSALRPRLLRISLSGASGNLSAMGPKGPEVRAAMAASLNLADPGDVWHTARDNVAELGAWLTAVTGSLSKMAEDLHLMSLSGISEIRLASAGGSSTMPQKNNPVQPGITMAIAGMLNGLNTTLQSTLSHQYQRDGASWLMEWMTLPQMVMGTARALSVATELAKSVAPNIDGMARMVQDPLDLIYAETISFALADLMPRPEAQAATKDMCKTAVADNIPLRDLAAAKWPDIDWAALCQPQNNLGEAVTLAKNFTTNAKVLD
ncbi:MAG: 3-carboxy-cis,cis-muconate cycloisomerase [Rhodovulum sp.]|nr:3-carboxy-cis,cis-muconate cycloisomerase [Rhodovulum sp.]